MKARPAPWYVKLALVATGFALVAVVELALRWLHPFPAAEGATSGFEGAPPCFIKEQQADGTEAYVVHPARRHSFPYQSFSAERSAESVLIFCLGGSAVHGYPYGAEVAFPKQLEAMLRRRHPQRSFEVVNVGGLSYGTERLKLLVDELVRYKPDLLIFYTGHNEFVEDDFFTGRDELPGRLARLKTVAQRLHVFRAIEAAFQPEPGEPSADPVRAFGIDVQRREGRMLSSRERTDAARRYRLNLEASIETARAHDVTPILCTTASNLGDWQPGAGSLSAALSDSSVLKAALSWAEARQSLAAGNLEPALSSFRQVLAIDPSHAEANYRIARLLRRLGRAVEAKAYFVKALELDGTPIRSRPAFNLQLSELASAEGVALVDVLDAFERLSPGGIPDKTLFWDYCHPNR